MPPQEREFAVVEGMSWFRGGALGTYKRESGDYHLIIIIIIIIKY
jgi:hypothetical protein